MPNDELSPSLFDSALPLDEPPVRGGGDSIWDPTLTRRVRVLLHTAPIHQLRAGDARRDDDLRHYDSLALAIKTLDVIAEHMGLEHEATRETVTDALTPLLSRMDERAGRAPIRERHRRMVERVIAALRNDEDAQRPFHATYQDVDDNGQVVERSLRFRLVQDSFGGHSTVLRLSPEAINLYFNALELDIEDAQAATEAIVQSQLRRGQFGQAMRSAQNALRQSSLYREHLERVVRETRRDVARVDWNETVPRLIADALAHLDDRIEAEQAILGSARERLEYLEPGSVESRQVARIGELIERCAMTHAELQRSLMTARTAFLDSQARQSFRPKSLRPRPNLFTDVLVPLLEAPAPVVAQVGDRALPAFAGARPPSIPSLARLVEGLLRPRVERNRGAVEMPVADPTIDTAELPWFRPEVRRIAEDAFRTLAAPTPLSQLLAELADPENPTAPGGADELAVLIALQHYDRDATEAPLVRVEPHPTATLQHPRFVGPDLILVPIESRNDDLAP